MVEEVRLSFEELHPINTEIDLTVGEVVRSQTEAMSTFKYSLVPRLFNQNFSVPKTSAHLTSSKRKLDVEDYLNVSNKISG